MAIVLTDDGTLDTVLRCTECGEEFRFNYFPDEQGVDEDTRTDTEIYDDFVQSCIEEVEVEHECTPEDDEPSEDTACDECGKRLIDSAVQS